MNTNCICLHRSGNKPRLPERQASMLPLSHWCRFGILPLNIETGRFRNQPIEQRICNLCELNEIEDELHFLFKCTLYNDCRKIWIENIVKIDEISFNWINTMDVQLNLYIEISRLEKKIFRNSWWCFCFVYCLFMFCKVVCMCCFVFVCSTYQYGVFCLSKVTL